MREPPKQQLDKVIFKVEKIKRRGAGGRPKGRKNIKWIRCSKCRRKVNSAGKEAEQDDYLCQRCSYMAEECIDHYNQDRHPIIKCLHCPKTFEKRFRLNN